MQRQFRTLTSVATTAVLLMVWIANNPYLGIQHARAEVGSYSVDADLHVREYDLLTQAEKAKVKLAFNEIIQINSQSEPRRSEFDLGAKLKSNPQEETEVVEVTPTPTQVIQIASSTINVKQSASRSAQTATHTVETTSSEVSPQAENTPSDIEALISTYAPQYGADPAKMAVIAKCESGFRPDAVSPSGAYVGLYQFVSGTWVSNRKAMGLDPNPALRANPEEAIKTAAFKMGRDGYGAWPVCGKI